MATQKQEIEIINLENGNTTIKVTDVYPGNEIMNYTWVLQNLTPETMRKLKAEFKKHTMSENARNMYAFAPGQKVIWLEGKYDHYFIKNGFRDNGVKKYDLENPNGVTTPGVREDEILAA